MRKNKSKSKLQRKYYGILRYSYTDKGIDFYSLLETQGDCCCFEEGLKIYDTKEDAISDMYDNEMPDKLVEFSVKIIKKTK